MKLINVENIPWQRLPLSAMPELFVTKNEIDKMPPHREYLLISVCENRIITERFLDLEKAQLKMMEEFCDAANIDLQDCSDPEWQDEECGYDERSAEVFDGTNHDNYSWLIVDI